jgi:hypothetical protein
MEGVVADLEGEEDEFLCNECFKTFLVGEARYHSTTEEEDFDLCEEHHSALSEAEKAKHKFEKIVREK